MNANKQRRIGVFLQYSQITLSAIISIICTPIIIKILGKTEYGIYNVAFSSISYLSLLSLGIGTSYIRFYSIYKRNNDDDGVMNLNGLYMAVFVFIGLLAFVLGFILSENVSWFYNDTYTEEEPK